MRKLLMIVVIAMMLCGCEGREAAHSTCSAVCQTKGYTNGHGTGRFHERFANPNQFDTCECYNVTESMDWNSWIPAEKP